MLVQKLSSGFKRIRYFVKTGYFHTHERQNPDFPNLHYWSHLAAYKFVRQLAEGRDVLDVGCGMGYGTAVLAEVATRAVGIDISRQALRWARTHYPRVAFVRMDAHDLRFPPESFDLVFSSENFEHLRDQALHLQQVHKVLRPGGWCVIATPNPEMSVGIKNRYHIKENTYAELLSLLSRCFAKTVIVENCGEPETAEGKTMRDRRFARGEVGIVARDGLEVLGLQLDTANLKNLHSFMCFATK